jgi:hypothetical protein
MTRREYIRLVACGLWISRDAPGSARDEIAVIVHPSNRFDSLSRSRLNYLFLRKVSRWPWGAEAVPIDLAEGAPIRKRFAETILGIGEEQLAEYWIDQRATRGMSPPLQVQDAAAVRQCVAARPGGIGYIPSSALDNTVKAIRIDL